MTPAQHQVLTAIKDLTVDGVSPSYRDLAHATGLGLSNVHGIADRLLEDGLVVRKEGRSRSLRVVGHFSPEAVAQLAHADLIALRQLIDARLAA